ncbi:non-ribosomal peptide synthetase [Chitinimonas arctica]|uniref:non-ribosomal peptide synthetase n=1 Tax=Chitinimonas arctica TaxID=2594795 RepID=UPI0027E4C17B|nr:amino acid adenylation domain-containing protein [Chitinimonas arctica]
MTVIDLISLLDSKGIALALKGKDLAVSGDQKALGDPQLLAMLRQHKPALVELLQSGQQLGSGVGGAVPVPPLLIPAGTERITPAMLTLVTLEQAAIDAIVATVEGGAANVQDIYPLAPLQEGMLFHHLLNPAADAYVEAYLLAFRSKARLERFLAALQTVMDRHDILRTGIVWEGLAQPLQVVRRQARLPLAWLELDPAQGEIAAQLQSRFDPRHYRLDIGQAPLLRCHAAQDPAQGRWLLNVLSHHLAIDHTTLALLIEEAQAIEQGQLDRLAPPVPFRNFVAQARLGVSERAHEVFFSEMLADIDAPTAPFGLMDVQGDGSDIVETRTLLDPEMAQALRAQARRLNVGAASVVHLAWALVLARLSGRSAVVFGTVLFGRMQGGAEADRVLGMLMNTLPLRLDIDGQGVEAALRQTHARLVQLLRHEHAPLALAQRCSGVAARTPLFTSLLNYRHSEETAVPSAAGEDDIDILLGHERTNYPLTLTVDDLGRDFAITAQVSAEIDPQRVCDFMLTALAQLLRALQQAPQQALYDIDVLPSPERAQVLAGWNDTAQAYPADQAIHQLFEAQVARTPNAIALVCEGEQLSYAELNARANRLAHALRQAGVGPDRLVGLCVERSVAMVVGLLATLKAGGAYVPLDPDYPAERLRHMLQDSAPVLVLVDRVGGEALATAGAEGVHSWHLQADAANWAGQSAGNLPAVSPGQLAYVIYTSGSTGRPKGVMNEHGAVVNRLLWMQQAYALDGQDVVLQKTPFSFDVSVWEFFWPLLAGARLVMARPEGHKDPAYLAGLIRQAGVTTLHFVPSMLQVFLGQGAAEGCDSLKRIFCSGEALPAALARQCLARLPQAELHNLYGPTEAAVDVTAWACRADDRRTAVPIGRPIANTRIYILDSRLQPVPVGVAGELYIGGVQVARGYLNQPELTAARFIDDPFAGKGRLYQSGDQARWLSDGSIEYLGRNDFQVKLRGLRIELGEIEACLAQVEGVREAVVLAREDVPGDMRLVAYYSGEAQSAEALRQVLGGALPAYMVPAAFVHLAALPLSPNGKLDRKALPAPQGDAYGAREFEAPQGDTEQLLAAIWAELLKIEQVGRHDNFFELGGHSLLAVQLLSRLRQSLQVDVPLGELFEYPLLAQLAERLAACAPRSSRPSRRPTVAAPWPCRWPSSGCGS